jgi:hypothetical protein
MRRIVMIGLIDEYRKELLEIATFEKKTAMSTNSGWHLN